MSEIENAPLWLNSLVVSHAFTSPEELLQKLVLHYRGQVRVLLLHVLAVHIRGTFLRWRFVHGSFPFASEGLRFHGAE